MYIRKLKGEIVFDGNCTVSCPCVISLGKHPPTEGCCRARAGVRFDKRHAIEGAGT